MGRALLPGKVCDTTYTADVYDLDVVPGPCRPGFNVSSLRVTRQ
jgi:hypothetical protein